MADRFCRGCGRKLPQLAYSSRKGWCSAQCRLRHKYRSMPHRDVLEEPVSVAGLARHWRVLPDEEFDRVWVYSLVDAVSRESEINLGALNRALHEVRRRYQRMRPDPAEADALLGHKVRHGQAKLNEAQVSIIRKIDGLTQKEIAHVFGVGQPNICHIRNRKSWPVQ